MTITNSNKIRAERFEDIAYIAANHNMSYDMARLFIGNKIGKGQFRSVYAFDMVPNTVIKVSDDIEDCNLMEWHVWQWVKDVPAYAKWFAPCLYCSPGGHFLIQKRTNLIPHGYKLPKEIPAIFTDLKLDNWGLLKGKLVCHDYGFLRRGIDVMMDAKRLVTWNEKKSVLRVKK